MQTASDVWRSVCDPNINWDEEYVEVSVEEIEAHLKLIDDLLSPTKSVNIGGKRYPVIAGKPVPPPPTNLGQSIRDRKKKRKKKK